MAQPSVSNISVNGMNPSDTKDQSEENCDRKQEGPQHNQPNVRHIPIFVEGRDKPLLNTNVERSPSGSQRQSSPTFNDLSRTGSIYDRAKDIPVRKPMQQNAGRTESPSRTIPINVLHKAPRDVQGAPAAGFHPHHQRAPQFEIPQIQKSASKVHSIPIKVEHASSQTGAPQPQKRHPSAMQQNVTDEVDAKSQPNSSVQQSLDAITKIQKIQHDVLDLMNRVEQFRGGSRTDKEYLYLDEMLTQNLLKLDTIDAEGKDNIKAARKEAINCINKCIAVLEAKIDSGTTASSKSDNQNGTEGHNQQKDQRIQQNQGQEQQTRNQPGQQQVSNS